MKRYLSFAILVLVTGAIGVLFFEVISVFLLPLFLATVIAIVFRPLHVWYLKLCRGWSRTAALMTTTSVLLIVLLPTVLVVVMAGNEAARLVRDLDNGEVKGKLQRARLSLGLDYPVAAEFRFIERSLERLLADSRDGAVASRHREVLLHLCEEWQRLQDKLNIVGNQRGPVESQPLLDALIAAREETAGTLVCQQAIERAAQRFRDYKVDFLGGYWNAILKDIANPTPDEVRHWTATLFAITPDRIPTFGGRIGFLIGQALFGVLILIVTMYFLFADGPRITNQLMALSPMEDRYELQLLAKFTLVARAVVSGSAASAMVQGVLAGAGFWFAGLQPVFLLTAVTALSAVIPFVGAAIVWLPVGLWLVFIDERPTAGIVLMVYGAGVVSTIDNVIKPWVLRGHAAMHPLAALIGVLGGFQSLGPLGVFVGPMVVAFLQTLLRLLHRELSALGAGRGRKSRHGDGPG